MLYIQLDTIGMNIFIKLMFDTQMIYVKVLKLYGLIE